MIGSIIMAGGASTRMKDTHPRQLHKALLQYKDKTFLESNIEYLSKSGINALWISFNAHESSVSEYIYENIAAWESIYGVKIELIIEEYPLGTIGAAGLVPVRVNDLVVVNVDNITEIDINNFIARHINTSSHFTIATHYEKFKIPYGELVEEGGIIREYREKAEKTLLVSSGTYILNRETLNLLQTPGGEPVSMGIPELFNIANAKGLRIHTFGHIADWQDINSYDQYLQFQKKLAL